MLFHINEYLVNGYNIYLLNILLGASIICAISVIITKNPILSVLFLIGLFLNVTSYLLAIGIIFIGLSYTLIYVGAISILFIFILMLINIRISELTDGTNNSKPLAILTAGVLSIILYNIMPLNRNFYNENLLTSFSNIFKTYNNENDTLISTINNWDSNLAEFNDIASLGNIVYTDLSIWLILTSLILLLAMVGAIVITIKQND